MQERVVALDIGKKRIGIAVSDPLNSYALPDNAYICTKNREQDMQSIAKIIQEKLATVVVCGMPVNVDGTESVQTVHTQKFIAKLKEYIHLPIVCVDERYTSFAAKESLQLSNSTKNRKSGKIDSVAACYILEEYLNQRKKEDTNKNR